MVAWMVNVHLKSGDRVTPEKILGRPSLAQRKRAKALREAPPEPGAQDDPDEA